jgi:hypothetical protein
MKRRVDFPGFNGHLGVIVETWEGLWGISADRSLSDWEKNSTRNHSLNRKRKI